MLITCIDAIDDAHNHLMDVEDNYQDACEYAVMRMMHPLMAAQRKMVELRRNQMCDDVSHGAGRDDLSALRRVQTSVMKWSFRRPSPRAFRLKKSSIGSALKWTSPTDGSAQSLSRTGLS